jgi:hypothetical protein
MRTEPVLSAERRRLHRSLVAVAPGGVLVRVPANAVVTGLASSPQRDFCEVLYDGRVLQVPAGELRDASSVCEAPRARTAGA